jgi:hypothetical protein
MQEDEPFPSVDDPERRSGSRRLALSVFPSHRGFGDPFGCAYLPAGKTLRDDKPQDFGLENGGGDHSFSPSL